ncbi:MAG: nucleotide exchange factor GrpE [Bacilli bacterium]|nr:nucleotide exchange factor GrpE [Bacilli bacterium]
MEKESAEKQVKKPKKNKHLEELEDKIKLLEEETLRAKADLINYRKRKDDEVSNLLKYSNADILLSLLPILDNFERVIDKEVESEELKSYLEGFRLIYNQIKDVLNVNEVKEIEALDKEFDPAYHQSITTRKDETKESGIVLEVYQKGYTYKDKVLRPAMVIINE